MIDYAQDAALSEDDMRAAPVSPGLVRRPRR